MTHSRNRSFQTDGEKKIKKEILRKLSGINHWNHLDAVLKLRSRGSTYLSTENEVLTLLKGKKGFQKTYYYGIHHEKSALVLDRLGTSVETVRVKSGGRLTRKDLLSVGMQTLERLESLHATEFVHGNICSTSIRLNKSSNTGESVLFLTDFKTAKTFPMNVGESPRVDANFCSMPFCEFSKKTKPRTGDEARKRDLESFANFMFLIGTGREICLNDRGILIAYGNGRIPQVRRSRGVSNERDQYPAFLIELAYAISRLENIVRYDYVILRSILEKEREVQAIKEDGRFDWEQKKEFHS